MVTVHLNLIDQFLIDVFVDSSSKQPAPLPFGTTFYNLITVCGDLVLQRL